MTTEELKNAAGFKAVDAEGNELGVVSLSDIVSAVKQELQPSGVARASVAALSEVSTQAATDTYEDQLPQKTDVTWIRGLDESGNPILISKQSLVSVAEGLIGTANVNNTGLISDIDYLDKLQIISGSNNQIYKVAQLTRNYCGFVAVGVEPANANTILFSVSRSNNIVKFNGTKPDLLRIYKDSNRYIYFKILSGIEATMMLISSGRAKCLVAASLQYGITEDDLEEIQ